uniref:Uncharacterized protein n=1 Tax=Kalanchoe fedtschenkoi TaxID=63787 RepID=A0A7N0U350_KALFE
MVCLPLLDHLQRVFSTLIDLLLFFSSCCVSVPISFFFARRSVSFLNRRLFFLMLFCFSFLTALIWIIDRSRLLIMILRLRIFRSRFPGRASVFIAAVAIRHCCSLLLCSALPHSTNSRSN